MRGGFYFAPQPDKRIANGNERAMIVRNPNAPMALKNGKRIMKMKTKRWIALLLALMLMLCACGSKEAPAPAPAATETTAAPTETAEAPEQTQEETTAQAVETADDVVDAGTMYMYMFKCMKDEDYAALKALFDGYVAEGNTEMMGAFVDNLNMHVTMLMTQTTKVGDFDQLWALLEETDAIVNPPEETEPAAPVDVHSRETAEAFLKILKANMEDVKRIIQAPDETMALITNPTVEDIMQGKLDSYFAVEDSVLYQSLYFMT